jgi:DNA-binding NarL/FixJ family response regulator
MSINGGSIRILIAEPTPMGCDLLRAALQGTAEGLEIVGTTTSAGAITASGEALKPDVAVVSMNLADGVRAGLVAVADLRAFCPETSSIVLLDENRPDDIIEAFRLGARGVFVRTEPVNTLAKAIRSVYAGQIWANTQQLHYVLKALTDAPRLRVVNACGENLLSKRQQQLVLLVAEGMTNREIADQLRLSEHTIKNYLFRIFDKLGVSTRAELILYVINQSYRNRANDAAAA